MQFNRGAWPLPALRGTTRFSATTFAELLLILGIAGAAVALFWALFRPLGPVGPWHAPGGSVVVTDPTLLTRFDPFFRNAGGGGPSAVTSLPLKLYGIRLDQAMGRGSAIIATPAGVQSSYAVGEEIVGGVKLKSVAFDHVVLERGGVDEQLFLDQSVAAPVAGAPGTPPPPPGLPGAPVPSAQISPQALAEGIAFAPRSEKGAAPGFVVAPKGSGTLFAQTGLVQGDVVTQINGQPVRSVDDIANAVVRVPPGGRLTFMIERNGTTMNVSAGGAK
ncbi:type II secretion system protein N [Sphingomonas sp. SUN039]|uniref:type II secretion system protein N n=1 Tax=Sphingomonas sp. SUN039 TaxID=2937787 RepID=UPI0021648654|nr:type II secretion system protein N [Sphingomonas sp. SUN039]UVO53922.1 PDZ domain-containing protein [Sphingomonas sp. SUN039]